MFENLLKIITAKKIHLQEVVNGSILNGSLMKLLLSQKYFHSSEMNDLNWSFLIFVVVSQVNKNESICVKKYEEKNIKLLKEKKKQNNLLRLC